MLVDLLLLAGIGKLLIFTIQKYPLTKRIQGFSPFFEELFSCDFCLGVWVYFILALIYGFDLFQGYLPYVPIVTEFLGGLVISFVVHLVSIGWRDKFSIMVIGE